MEPVKSRLGSPGIVTSHSRRRLVVPQEQPKQLCSELKDVAHVMYKSVVIMVEYVETCYDALIIPEVREFRSFLFYKQEVIMKTAELVAGLKKVPQVQIQRLGQNYILAIYDLHQYLLQLVIDAKHPTKPKLLELQRGLAVLNQTAIVFGRELDVHVAKSSA